MFCSLRSFTRRSRNFLVTAYGLLMVVYFNIISINTIVTVGKKIWRGIRDLVAAVVDNE